MYGGGSVEFPRRIVCLSAEHVEICYALGAGSRVVGVPGTAHHPAEARDKTRVGGFTAFRTDRILGLRPDLVLAFSDLQGGVAAELIREGLPVLCTNQRSIGEMLQAILMVGGALGLPEEARACVLDLREEIRQVREFSSMWPHRPRVYFEERPEPPMAGICWVSEIIEIAGGRDIFSELRDKRLAADRIVDPAEVIRRDPEIILAACCGKPVDREAVRARAGWGAISAVRRGEIHEIEGVNVLAPGPSLMAGMREIHEIIQRSLARA
jgi:iron complex transport system substrate-binding protein